jgi:hypothetical protein
MVEQLLLLLVLLQIKHWYIDFVNQTTAEIASKGIYGDQTGLNHSIKHGLATVLCCVAITGIDYIPFAMLMGLVDFVLHYHVDWAKIRYGNGNIKTKEFWTHLGADQMAHQLTYICIAWMVFA